MGFESRRARAGIIWTSIAACCCVTFLLMYVSPLHRLVGETWCPSLSHSVVGSCVVAVYSSRSTIQRVRLGSGDTRVSFTLCKATTLILLAPNHILPPHTVRINTEYLPAQCHVQSENIRSYQWCCLPGCSLQCQRCAHFIVCTVYLQLSRVVLQLHALPLLCPFVLFCYCQQETRRMLWW